MKLVTKKVIALVLLLLFSVFLFFTKDDNKANDYYVDEILNKCFEAKDVAKCYDNSISDLMKKISMEEAFFVTSQIQQRDKRYPYCHVLGHRLASIETKKDVSKWKQVLARCPVGVCSNGCVHGAFQEKYRTDLGAFETLELSVEELRDVCDPREDWNPSGLERGSCYHAIGHLLMYISNADINLSLKICDDIGSKPDGDFRSVCYDGAFMQIYQPLEQEDKELIVGKEVNRQSVDTFCKQFTNLKLESCVIESWPLYSDEIQTAKGVQGFCSKLAGESMMACYRDVFYLAPIQFGFDQRFMAKYCSQFENDLGSMCAGTMASRILEIDYNNFEKAINFCEIFESKQQKDCLESLVNYADFAIARQKDKYDTFCNIIKERHGIDCMHTKIKL